MLFNSIDYLIFFPIVVLMYFIIPRKIRMYWLLVASYYFYMSWDAIYGLLILFSTGLTYICGLILEYIKEHFKGAWQKRFKVIVIFISLGTNLGLLFYFKYTNFLIDTINAVSQKIGVSASIPQFDIVLPVGISFFIFQALGYTIDVYRNELKAEKNPCRYALFVAFFPQLVAGPIERSKNLLVQLKTETEFHVENVRSGLLTIAYGLFMKMVVADNIAFVVDMAFSDPDKYSGNYLLFATILFAFQIYCDFNGYTQIAIGSARVLGFQLNQNFDTPYMALSIKDFWKRWHISLTSWFRDYLYIPLGGSRKGNVKKQINTMIVFLCSGLWHGAAWHYVVWGGANGVFSVMEDLCKGWNEKLKPKFFIDKSQFMYRFFARVGTFVLIDFTWLFFRAEDCASALDILKTIIDEFRIEWFIEFNFVWTLDTASIAMVIFPLLIVIVIDVLQYYGKDIKAAIFNQQILFRWMIYMGILLAILYWGLYGTGYEQSQFIYFQF